MVARDLPETASNSQLLPGTAVEHNLHPSCGIRVVKIILKEQIQDVDRSRLGQEPIPRLSSFPPPNPQGGTFVYL